MRQIATELGLSRNQYRLDYLSASPDLAGDHVLEAQELYLRVSAQRWGGEGVSWRNPHWRGRGAVMRRACVSVLRDIPAFAARLRAELGIAERDQQKLL